MRLPGRSLERSDPPSYPLRAPPRNRRGRARAREERGERRVRQVPGRKRGAEWEDNRKRGGPFWWGLGAASKALEPERQPCIPRAKPVAVARPRALIVGPSIKERIKKVAQKDGRHPPRCLGRRRGGARAACWGRGGRWSVVSRAGNCPAADVRPASIRRGASEIAQNQNLLGSDHGRERGREGQRGGRKRRGDGKRAAAAVAVVVIIIQPRRPRGRPGSRSAAAARSGATGGARARARPATALRRSRARARAAAARAAAREAP